MLFLFSLFLLLSLTSYFFRSIIIIMIKQVTEQFHGLFLQLIQFLHLFVFLSSSIILFSDFFFRKNINHPLQFSLWEQEMIYQGYYCGGGGVTINLITI